MIASPAPAMRTATPSPVAPVWAAVFGAHPGIDPQDEGLLVIGAGSLADPVEGTVGGLGLSYPLCLVVGPPGSTTTSSRIVDSGLIIPLPSGSFQLP